MGFLAGKRALVLGVASDRSIAWGIAQAMRREGAELAFTYQNERLAGRVRDLAARVDSDLCLECDVGSDESIGSTFEALAARWPQLDIVIHAVAFAPREALQGTFLDHLTRDAFRIAHDISAYSFAAVAAGARPMMTAGGALLTLSYLGAERAMPNYNVMGPAKASLEATVRYMAVALGPEGIRVNAVSAGPIRTLAASGINNFRRLLDQAARVSPMRRNVTIDEVGNVAAFLCSDLASGITGEITYVDAGFNVVGGAAPADGE
ncbi:MAG: enoyl-ACP reductase [Ectothiorhodospiraceae bacterium]|nr:enoyl-ACP reductase [Chromatiales bacterium]MCP5157397.1 enoyl-ACP reductase [Ectothiorhodospiraceae bacterium]